MKRIPKAVYTNEFRKEAVKLAMAKGVGVAKAARRVSISMETLANQVRAAKDGKLENIGQTQKPLTEIEAERTGLSRSAKCCGLPRPGTVVTQLGCGTPHC